MTILGAAAAGLASPAVSQGGPNEPKLEYAFEETVSLGEKISAGTTPLGERFIIPITGGTFEGPDLKGTIMPGGWDWQLKRADGCLEVKAGYFLKTDDGVIINVVNVGLICPGTPVRTHPKFEAPLGKYEWIGRSSFVGTLEPVMRDGKLEAVHIRFYKAI